MLWQQTDGVQFLPILAEIFAKLVNAGRDQETRDREFGGNGHSQGFNAVLALAGIDTLDGRSSGGLFRKHGVLSDGF
ncbi:MAG: hypothetical protein ACI9BK_003032 [Acidimicrobiales bacterium]|jgi:hypothetical protein